MLSSLRSFIPPARAAAAALCLAASGCALDAGGRADTAEGIPHDQYDAIGYRLDWRGFPSVGERQRVRVIRPYADVVVVQESGSAVTAMEPGTGQVRWTNQLANPLTRFLDIHREGNRLLVPAEAQLHVLDLATGNLVDRQTYEKVASSGPVHAGSTLIFGTGVGEVLAHFMPSTVQGIKLWGFGMTGAIEVDPALIGGAAVGVICQSGEIAILGVDDGRLVGRARILGGASADPAASDSMMFVSSLDQSVYGIEADGGAIAWRYRTPYPVTRPPVYHERTVYVALRDEGLVAFDAASGAVRWKSAGVDGRVVGVRAGRLLAWDGQVVSAIDPRTGDVLARATLPRTRALAMDAFVDGNLYVASDRGVVSKFVPSR